MHQLGTRHMRKLFFPRVMSLNCCSCRRTLAAAALSRFAKRVPLSSSSVSTPLVMGCVDYDPSVGAIWSGIKDYVVQDCGVPFDFVLFNSYEALVRSLLLEQVDVAWNGPVAHVITEELSGKIHEGTGKRVVSLGMRDCDRDFESILIVRKGSGISNLRDLKSRSNLNVLAGAQDSPQAHIVPLYHLQQEQGIEFETIKAFDFDLGKHGDTAVGEIRAIEAMVATDEPDQDAALVVSRMMWDRALRDQIPGLDAHMLQQSFHEISDAGLPRFDHCQFDTILNEDTPTDAKIQKVTAFGEAIMSMDWENPRHQRLMEMEGIQKEWKPPRQEGYDVVRKAMMGSKLAAQLKPATNFHYRLDRSFSTMVEKKDLPSIAVVGAGIAGLQTLRSLKGHGFPVTAFEASDTVGGVWKGNYSNFGIQVPKQLFEFQDYPMKDVPRGQIATGSQVQSYIENYTDDLELRDLIHFNTWVKSVTQEGERENLKWKLETQTKDGKEETQSFDYLVICTGLYSSVNKNTISFSNQDSFKGGIVHSSDFQDASLATDKNVVVIGGGKSAVDCAVEAAKAGTKSVTMLQRKVYWPTPRNMAGLIPFQHVFLSRFGQGLVSTHVGAFPGTGPAVNAARNSVVLPWLAGGVLKFVQELFAFQFNLNGDLKPKGDIVADLYKVAYILNSDWKDLRNQGTISVCVGEISSCGDDGKSLVLKDGSTIPADMVVSATGFAQDYSIFTDSRTRNNLGIEEDGIWLYRGILPCKLANLAFIGNMAAISNISCYGLQAEWLARHLAGGKAISPDVMIAEIDKRKQWARDFIPSSPMRGMSVLLHQTHCHDELLKDMGENPQRKSNPFAEYLMPYEPSDYDGIMSGRSKTA